MALISAADRLPLAVDAQLEAATGLTTFEYMLLGALHSAENSRLRMSDLASSLSSPVPRVSKTVTRLSRRSLVARASERADGRAIWVVLTGEGVRTYLASVIGYTGFVLDDVFSGFSSDELHQITDLLERVLENLEDEEVTRQAGGSRR